MSILEKYTQFVNDQIAFHKNQAERYKSSKFRNSKHLETARQFESLLDYIRQSERKLEARPQEIPPSGKPKQLRLSLTPEELEGLPQELLSELSSGDRTEFLILNILEDLGGIASLDQLLVGIFRRTKEIVKRSTLTSRLYRMAQRNLLYTAPGKKGVYSLQPLSKEEVEQQFGTDPIDLFS